MIFGRQVLVEIGRPGEDARVLRDLRVTFRVMMSRAAAPNGAVIEVYNPAPRTISAVQERGSEIRLLAGYDVPRLIFAGAPTPAGCWMQTRGPDRILHIEAQDGGDAWRQAHLSVSWSTATTTGQVLDEVAAQLGLPRGVIRLGRELEFPQGVTLRGPARDVMDRLARMHEADWFVRDGVLYLIEEGGHTGETAVEIAADRGNLVGSPEPKDGALAVTALLDPAIRPGRRFALRSRDYSGIYVAREVVFAGDSGFDAPFYAQIVGTPT